MSKALSRSSDMRPRVLGDWAPPSLSAVHDWVTRLGEGGEGLLSIGGPNPLYRAEAFRLCFEVPGLTILGGTRMTQDWLTKGVLADLTQRVRSLTDSPWGLLWGLLAVEDFIVEEPLRGLIDQGFRFTGFYKALWEARFLLHEDRKRESGALLGALIRWMSGSELSPEQQALLGKVQIEQPLTTNQEKLDMLLFLLALVYQNGLADRTLFVLDGVERVVRLSADKRKDMLQQLDETVQVFERWLRLGSATGLIFGLDPAHDTVSSLMGYNKRVGKKVFGSLV